MAGLDYPGILASGIEAVRRFDRGDQTWDSWASAAFGAMGPSSYKGRRLDDDLRIGRDV